MRLLDRSSLPSDLSSFSLQELKTLAQEIRDEILTDVSKNGGHLAPSLGVVELTLALHAVLKSPKDKIIWDVGHQAYAHKLLTGRAAQFHTLRQKDGISGFAKRSESPHDIFGVGHASTSISAALGVAKARDIKGDDYSVFAVIGDGSLSGGLAFEALNNIRGKVNRKFCVILNDNDMSINKPVGTISNIITKLRLSKMYVGLRQQLERMLKHIPQIGEPLADRVTRFVERTRELLLAKPEEKMSVLFEEFGFRYLGPIDGHNIPMLMGAIRYAKDADQPVLLHVLTQKGKGYVPAEKDPTKFHGVPPFTYTDYEVIMPQGKLPSYTDIFGRTLVKIAEHDQRIVAITAAMAEGTGLSEFSKRFPARFFDVGIAEEHAVTFAAGLATEGIVPVVALYSTFLQRSYDQVVHDVCLQKLPVILALDRGGIVGEDGATHAGVFDYSFLRHIPDIVVMAPKDENELQHMLFTATKLNGPVSVRYPRGTCQGVPLEQQLHELPVGKGEVVYRSPYILPQGKTVPKKVSLIAIGTLVPVAVGAAKLLEGHGFTVTVVNARFVKPLDRELILQQADDHDHIVTIEENVVAGGFGSAVAELLLAEKRSVSVTMIGIPDEFIIQGKPAEVRTYYGLTDNGIAATVSAVFGEQISSPEKSRNTIKA